MPSKLELIAVNEPHLFTKAKCSIEKFVHINMMCKLYELYSCDKYKSDLWAIATVSTEKLR